MVNLEWLMCVCVCFASFCLSTSSTCEDQRSSTTTIVIRRLRVICIYIQFTTYDQSALSTSQYVGKQDKYTERSDVDDPKSYSSWTLLLVNASCRGSMVWFHQKQLLPSARHRQGLLFQREELFYTTPK